jgi:hypothetical protein
VTTKQEKGAYTTALRAGARRAKVGFVVAVVTSRNREMGWKWVRAEAAKLVGVSPGAVEKMEEAAKAFRFVKHVQAQNADAQFGHPDLDLAAYVAERDLTEPVAVGATDLHMLAADEMFRQVPPMKRGRKPKK